MPSLNSTEGFGLVQVEAMSWALPWSPPTCWRACTRKDERHGRIVPVADAGAIARAILDIFG